MPASCCVWLCPAKAKKSSLHLLWHHTLTPQHVRRATPRHLLHLISGPFTLWLHFLISLPAWFILHLQFEINFGSKGWETCNGESHQRAMIKDVRAGETLGHEDTNQSRAENWRLKGRFAQIRLWDFKLLSPQYNVLKSELKTLISYNFQRQYNPQTQWRMIFKMIFDMSYTCDRCSTYVSFIPCLWLSKWHQNQKLNPSTLSGFRQILELTVSIAKV